MEKKYFKLFQKYDTYQVFETRKKLLMKQVKTRDSIIDKETLKKKYFDEFSFKPLEIDFKNMKRLKTFDRKRKLLFYIYYLPYRGTPDLLQFNASNGISGWTLRVLANDRVLCFKKMTFMKNPEDYSEEIKTIKKVIEEETKKINTDVKYFNHDISKIIEMSLN